MIETGVKKEEYRVVKPYWAQRIDEDITHVQFRYGYTSRTMLFEVESIFIGRGKPEWGAPDEDVFIIKLGKRCE